MSTTQQHGNIPSTAAEFAPITDVDLALAAELAQQLRVDSIRSSTSAGSGHPTSSMSAADLLAVLVGRHLPYDWDEPGNPGNDHLIFSKGHASPLLYSVYKAVGVVSDEELMTGYRRFGSPAGGAPYPGAALGRRGHRLAGAGPARRRGRGAGRQVPRRAAVPGLGPVRRQRDGRGLHLGGPGQGLVLQAVQPDRDGRRQPARPARPHRPELGRGHLRRPRGGVRRPGVRHRRPRPGRDRPGGGRGRPPGRPPAVRHRGSHPQGSRFF